ncbi:MAG: hypothetical protein JWP69_2122 [Flaviaesturariibacter sp.]|nr:hypothetical protein [Flaviaesturariibacter sp.]
MPSLKTLVALSCFIILCACTGPEKKAGLPELIVGNWLIAYPKHTLKTPHQQEVYGRYQDSLVNLFGLKLISFDANGAFKDMDSAMTMTGKWALKRDSSLRISGGGNGFNPFIATVRRIARGRMQLVQYLPLEDERIKVTWYLEKIDEDHAGFPLFDSAMNGWRRKPVAQETVSDLKKRLASMLSFYGAYFATISGKANYFSPTRVHLPFEYYAHGLGMSTSIKTSFRELFYNEADANTAYELLETTISSLSKQYPSGKTYTEEYGAFLKLMADKISK